MLPGNRKLKTRVSRSVTKVTKGTVSKRKIPFLKRLFNQTGDVNEFIVWDILIPALKETVLNILSGGGEMLLYGSQQKRNRGVRRDRGRYVSYSGYYDSEKERPKLRSIDRHRFHDLLLEARGDAEEVLSSLCDLVEDYGVATVADLLGFVGLESEWSDHKFGWDNLSSASIQPVRGGYILDLPKPLSIEQ